MIQRKMKFRKCNRVTDAVYVDLRTALRFSIVSWLLDDRKGLDEYVLKWFAGLTVDTEEIFEKNHFLGHTSDLPCSISLEPVIQALSNAPQLGLSSTQEVPTQELVLGSQKDEGQA